MLMLDSSVKVFRLSQTSGNKSSYTTWTVSIESTTQPLGDEKTAFYGGSHGKMFKIFLDAFQDVKEGDQIKDYEGNVYQVVAGGVEKRTDGFIADYLGVIVKRISSPDRYV